MRASRDQQKALYKLLASSGRLVLLGADDIASDELNGAFAVYKDATRDRLIVDARPGNRKTRTLGKWTRTLAMASVLLGIHLEEGQVLALFSDDLIDYYHMFIITPEQQRRNGFRGAWDAGELRAAIGTAVGGPKSGTVYAGLNTMAMGNTNSVEFGQAAHIAMAVEANAIADSELIRLHGRIPRSSYCAGIMIDDHVGLEVEPAATADPVRRVWTALDAAPPGSVGAARFESLNRVYAARGLAAHEGKARRRTFKHTFWGSETDGLLGTIRAPVGRVLALSELTMRIYLLGVSSIGLLEVLAGSWVAVLTFRRPLMVLLQRIYAVRRGKMRSDVVRLSEGLLSELALLAILAPLAVSNLRASGAEHIYASDASNWGTAHVRASIPRKIGTELARHAVSRGAWTRLLSPYQEWLRRHGLLDPADELPGGSLEAPTPLWADVVRSLTFELRKRARTKGRRPHINIGEVRGAIDAVRDAAQSSPSSRMLLGLDSQVALGAFAKGRSSSNSINAELEKSLPWILGGDIYVLLFWVWTHFNPADDPTRHLPVRSPDTPLPSWWAAVLRNDYSSLDSIVSALESKSGAELAELQAALEQQQEVGDQDSTIGNNNINQFSIDGQIRKPVFDVLDCRSRREASQLVRS